MKKLISLIILIFLLLPQSVFADEEFSIWTNQTFLPANGSEFLDREKIVTSSEITNPNDYSSLNILVRYLEFIPDSDDGPVSYDVQAIIEGKMLTGEWIPVHYQTNGINSLKDAPFRILTISPDFGIAKEPANNYTVKHGAYKLAQFSVVGGHLMKAFRVIVINNDPTGETPLTSIRFRGIGRKFGREFVPAGQP